MTKDDLTKGKNVEFGQSDISPDPIQNEEAVQPKQDDLDFVKKNIAALMDLTRGCITEYFKEGDYKRFNGATTVTTKFSKEFCDEFLPKIEREVKLSKPVGFDGSVLRISYPGIQKEDIRSYIEKWYGQDIRHTGIYEEIGLDGSGVFNTEKGRFYSKMLEFFPQFRKIKALEDICNFYSSQNFVFKRNNEYMKLLQINFGGNDETVAKAFLKGVIDKANTVPTSHTIMQDFPKTAELDHFIGYAKEVKMLERVKEFYRLYQRLN